jgi:TonB family protein
MKKLLIVLILALFSVVAYSQERELSDYEKYKLEQEQPTPLVTQEDVFYIVEDMPKFNGKDAKEFRKFIAKNVKYPVSAKENEIEGKVFISFVVNKHGVVANVKVERGVDPYLDAEAIRVVESSPKWEPGKQGGKAVAVQYTFPINFILDIEVTETEEAQTIVNNYYFESEYIYRDKIFFESRPFYRSFSYYNYYDPYYYGSPYYSYNSWNYGWYGRQHYNYYPRSYYNYNKNYYNKGGRYYASSALGTKRNYSNAYSKTYKSGFVINNSVSSKKNTVAKGSTVKKPMTTRSQTKTYSPTYNKPKATTSTARTKTYSKPASRPTQQRSTAVKSHTNYKRHGGTSRSSSSSYSRSTPSRSYSTPSRSSGSRSSSYSRSTPSRSSSTPSRSSGSRSTSSSKSKR